MSEQREAYEAQLKHKDEEIAELTTRLKRYEGDSTGSANASSSKRPRLNNNANDSNRSQQRLQGKGIQLTPLSARSGYYAATKSCCHATVLQRQACSTCWHHTHCYA
jgi:hypothetical protein